MTRAFVSTSLAKSQGVSERTAQRRVKQNGTAKTKKDEQKARARRIRDNGGSLRDIAAIVLGDRNKHKTIANWLDD